MTKSGKYFFSVSMEQILTDQALAYDLYMNSSSLELREHFVLVIAKNDSVTKDDLKLAKKKYIQLYVSENQREDFLKSLIQHSNITEIEKTQFIKDSAIHYLDNLFDKEKEFNTVVLTEILNGCRFTVEAMVDLLKNNDVEKIQLLISNLSYHDFYTYDHSINVSMYCISLFKSIKPKASREEIIMAGMAGMFHDIGKLKIPTDILNKPTTLEAEEHLLINQHPQIGHDLLKNNPCQCQGINFEVLQRVVHEHHEAYNGSGYPNKLKGTEIHFLARLTAIADFFDAITTKRTYQEVLNINEALRLMNSAIGKKLDPKLFLAFTKNVDQLIFKAKLNAVLPEDFDPCQPHNVLPLEKIKPYLKKYDNGKSNLPKHHGKIIKKAS